MSTDNPESGPLHDWITLWQSEISGLAVDREAQEALQAMVALWAASAHAMADLMMPKPARAGHEHAPGSSGAAAPPGAPAAAAAPDPRDAEIDRLHGRVADLERRLGDLERPATGHRPAPRAVPPTKRGRKPVRG